MIIMRIIMIITIMMIIIVMIMMIIMIIVITIVMVITRSKNEATSGYERGGQWLLALKTIKDLYSNFAILSIYNLLDYSVRVQDFEVNVTTVRI